MVHWPGDPPVRIRKVKEVGRAAPAARHFLGSKDGAASVRRIASCTLSHLSMGSHTGTHMDAPAHFLKGGRAIDRLPLNAVVGPARVIEVRDPEVIRVEELRPHRICRGERILFKTRNSGRVWKSRSFTREFVHLTADSARFLARVKPLCVGVDYLSVGGYKRDGSEVHRLLLGAGIWIIEGLDLSKARPGRYELICLPLKISGGDGAPARAVLRKL